MNRLTINRKYLEKFDKKNGHFLSRADIYFSTKKAYKIYFTNDDFNKIEEKIKFFHRLNLEDTCNPLEIVNVDGEDKGFSMQNFCGNKFKNLKSLDLEDRIKFLSMARDALERIHANKITVGDIHGGNILFSQNKNQIKFCDIDSFIIDGEETLVNFIGSLYRRHFGIIDQRCDIFLFNILSLSILFGEKECDIRNLVEHSFISSSDKVLNNILRFIAFFEENEDCEKYILDCLPEQRENFVKELCI